MNIPSEATQRISVGDLVVESKPQRQRVGRRGRAGYSMTDQTDSLEFMELEVADIVQGDGVDLRGFVDDQGNGYKYLSHPADIILNSWGSTMEQAFEMCGLSMYNYKSNLNNIECNEVRELHITADSLDSLLFNFMEEALYLYSADRFIGKTITITDSVLVGPKLRLVVQCKGDLFNAAVHQKGTEIKAITRSNLQIQQKDGKFFIYLLVDI